MRRAVLLTGLAFVFVAGAFGRASAWVRTTTNSGTPIFWPGSCTWVFADSAGTPDLPFDTVRQVVSKSVANWQDLTRQAGCAYLVIGVDPPAAGEAVVDHKNIVKFRTDKWCRPAEDQTAEMCFSDKAAAITTVFYTSQPGTSSDGQIVDADIELNNLNFTFVVEPTATLARPGTTIADLENTLTHELGHFQGLDHTCWDHTQPTAPIDGATGQPVPDCNNIPVDQRTRIMNATMYNYAAPGEIIKRTPETDDVAGICAAYPVGNDPNSCAHPSESEGGCGVGAPAGNSAPIGRGAAALSALGLVVAVRRRRRK